jgi:hypothetical protein
LITSRSTLLSIHFSSYMSLNPVPKVQLNQLYIDCKIEGEKNVLSYYTTINMAQVNSGKDKHDSNE